MRLRMQWNGDHIMPQGKSTGRKLVLVDHAGLGRVNVDMEAFFEFSFWMAEELEELVATHRIQSRQPDLFSR